MNDNIRWNQKELERIQDALTIVPVVTRDRSLERFRAEAHDRYNSRFNDWTTGETLFDHIDPSSLAGADQHASDALTVRNIRHRYTNYARFWDGKERTPLHDIIWLIGFIKVEQRMKSLFPELADAISLETIKRVSAKDRATLRATIFHLVDKTTINIQPIPYAELCFSAAEGYNTKRLPHEPSKSPMNASEQDEAMQQRIKEEIVSRCIDDHSTPPVFYGLHVLDAYNQSVARERHNRKALDALADYYPELAETCQRRIDKYSKKTRNLMDINLGSRDLVLYGSASKKVFMTVIKTYNNEHEIGILDGRKPNLYLDGAPQAIRTKIHALAVEHILTHSSRYPEFIDIVGSMPEPTASIQKAKIRRLFLDMVPQRYPEHTEAVQVELRLLTPEPEAAIAS